MFENKQNYNSTSGNCSTQIYESRLQAISTQEAAGIKPVFYKRNKGCCYSTKLLNKSQLSET